MSERFVQASKEKLRELLERLLRELMQLNSSAARSLEEGMDEMLSLP